VSAAADTIRDAQWYLGFLHVDEAHRYSEGAGITVAVVDSGVDGTHPDLAGNVLPGAATYLDANGDGRTDTYGHGTRMAGIIAAHGHAAGGATGILGVAPKAAILPIRAGEGLLAPGIARGVDWATDHGAKVISISLAGPIDNTTEQAVEKAIAHDVVVVAGVGNLPRDTHVMYPAAYPGVVAVAGVDEKGNHASFSVTGHEVMLAAPGANIVTTGLNHGYGTSSGTSDSTAIVAATAALIRARFPSLSATEVIHRLTATATDKGPPGRDDEYGYGVVNLVAALTADMPPLEATPSPATADSSPVVAERNGQSARLFVFVGLFVVLVLAAIAAVALVGGQARK
jgi:type VII secretion-associated serine protease mycosin